MALYLLLLLPSPFLPLSPVISPDLRAALTNVLLNIATVADGVRCDMAMLMLNSIFYQTWSYELDRSGYKRPTTEFWTDAIRTVRARAPNFIFLGETYWDGTTEALRACGFQFLYDKVCGVWFGAVRRCCVFLTHWRDPYYDRVCAFDTAGWLVQSTRRWAPRQPARLHQLPKLL